MNSLLSLPIDSCPCFCPTWDEIKGKAHMYRTARLRSTGQYVSLWAVNADGFFAVLLPGTSLVKTYSTEELCDFCL